MIILKSLQNFGLTLYFSAEGYWQTQSQRILLNILILSRLITKFAAYQVKQMKKRYWLLTFIVFFGWLFGRSCSVSVSQDAIKRVNQNYSTEVEEICKEMKMPAPYFKALIILECSAKKNPPSRYEHHVFEKLRAVRNGSLNSYSGIRKVDLENYSDQTIKQLATSWGALQLMGYNCIRLNIGIDELRGKNSLRHSIAWCKDNYGNYLENKDFRNAFHIHNTGKPHPTFWFSQTHDPAYVNRGIAYANAMGVQRNKITSTIYVCK